MSKQMHHMARAAAGKIALALTLAVCGGFANADEFKGTLLLPWEAHAKVYDVGPNTLMFVGEVTGTLYADAGKGLFDAALAICPMLYEIDVENGNTRSEGRCAFYPKGGEGVIYATYSCHGQIGSCAGKLDLTGGTGKFEGITGSGEMVSRTGAGELAIKLGPGGGITDAEGLMRLSNFSAKTR
jgi:hypothetical protein